MTKNPLILLILITSLHFYIDPVYSENVSVDTVHSSGTVKFILDGDVLYKTDSEGRTKLYDKVGAISGDDGAFYYIRSSGDKWIAGIFKNGSEAAVEFDLPGKYGKLYKFAGWNKVFYYSAEPVSETDENSMVTNPANKPVFIRYNPDQPTFQSVEGVTDFALVDGKSVVLKDNILDYNGLLIPLLLSGKLKITGLIDSRIAVISGEDGTEIVDLIAEKSIYQYREKSVPESPSDHNIILEFGDKITGTGIPTDADNSIYYEILIDGVEETRTETGRGDLSKIFHSKLLPGRYHIIKPERWELDKVKGRYARMNNVYQPSELKVYIPDNRIIKIRIEFNGTGYIINQSVLFK
jgi:hypothetical protein